MVRGPGAGVCNSEAIERFPALCNPLVFNGMAAGESRR